MNNSWRFKVLFEDNHLIAVHKPPGVLVQGDHTGDLSLVDEVKQFLKEKYNKPGNVFCGLIHRIDRPVSGIVLLAKTSKALSRMNKQFQERKPDKRYWAIVEGKLDSGLVLEHYLIKNQKQNKSYVSKQTNQNAKKAKLEFNIIKTLDNFTAIEIKLHTGRHHQIRTQLSAIEHIIKGDVKYGARRPNRDKSICLHAQQLEFEHPVKKGEIVSIESPAHLLEEGIWKSV
ncbi:MAG: RNA pseudouridine synthase [Flavobacteriales bacterium]|nr:RNA pseudouridine synthase [Flavobacteriales bacterium]